VPGGGGASGVAGAPGLAGYALFATVGGGSRAGVPTGGDPPHRGISGADRDTATGGVWAGSAGASGGVSTIGGGAGELWGGGNGTGVGGTPGFAECGLSAVFGARSGEVAGVGAGSNCRPTVAPGAGIGCATGIEQ